MDTADVFIKLFILGENELHDLREKKILKIRDENMCWAFFLKIIFK